MKLLKKEAYGYTDSRKPNRKQQILSRTTVSSTRQMHHITHIILWKPDTPVRLAQMVYLQTRCV
eukprot:26364-Eustigmatos_ZCMA.PRE.1